MTERRRIRPEDGVIVYLISFLVMQLLSLALSATEGDLKTYLSYLIPQVCYIGVSAVYLIATRTEFRFLPRRENLKAWHYGLAVTAALGIFFFALLPNYGLQILFEKIGKTATVTVPALDEAKDYVLCLITLCILPSIGEELVFRKIFCDGFSAYGGRIAVAMSGVLFGLSHLNLAQTVHQVFLGCLLAYLYMKTSNITLTVLIHFINNFLALFLTSITGAEMWNNDPGDLLRYRISFACFKRSFFLQKGSASFGFRRRKTFGFRDWICGVYDNTLCDNRIGSVIRRHCDKNC